MSEAAFAADHDRAVQVRDGAVVVTTAPAVFGVTGAGALACLQGLLTNDLDRPGDRALVYGAFLTPKGMIIADYWVLRQPGAFTLVGSPAGRGPTIDLFRRRLPPRLAQVTDETDTMQAVWLLGRQSGQRLAGAGIRAPDTLAHVSTFETADGPLLLAYGSEPAPFAALAVGSPKATSALTGRLIDAGAMPGTDRDLQTARILAGWPMLGIEIDERTLPQEVRYDEIGGVSYTKGCYVGQETVARLHFRGHTNRELRGLRWEGTPPLDGTAVMRQEKNVGVIRSTLMLEDRILGLGTVRREVAIGDMVEAGGRQAQVVELPFSIDELER